MYLCFKNIFVVSLCIFFCLSKLANAEIKLTRITEDNASELVRHGPDAIGGIGDWFISNGSLCAVISDIAHENEFSSKGGSLIDLGYCGRADDYYTSEHDLINANRSLVLHTEAISAEQGPDWAAIIVSARQENTKVVTRYKVNLAEPTQLQITKRVSLVDAKKEGLNLFNLLNFNLRSLEPFVFNSKNPKASNGFELDEFTSREKTEIRHYARNADTIISISPPNAPIGIAYGWHIKAVRRIEGEQSIDLPKFVLADNVSNSFLILPDTFYIGDNSSIGLLQMLQIPLLSLSAKSEIEIDSAIYIAKRGNVAAITDQLLKGKDRVHKLKGTTKDLNSAIHIDHIDGSPLTHVRPQANGEFSALVPEGKYQIRHEGTAGRQTKTEINLTQSTDLGQLNLAPASKLNLPQGKHPMRLVFTGINGTPDPDLADTLTKASVNDGETKHASKIISHVFLAGIESDQTSVDLAPGDYRIYATHGPEFSLEASDISLKHAENKQLDIDTPRRLINTPNHIAGDLHVHSGISFDNAFSTQERIRSFVAENGEVIVSSEHDMPVDFAPRIKAMQVDSQIVSIAAVEITSLALTKANPYTGGHINVFPFKPKPHHHRNGLFNHEENRLRDTIHLSKQRHANALVQLNHPRQSTELSGTTPKDYEDKINYGAYFEHMGPAAHPYQPDQPLHSHPNNNLIEKDPVTGIRDIDIDLLELVNPSENNHADRLIAVRKDWLSLIKQGEIITGTANSDSHTPHEVVGIPRTMVAMQKDSITDFNEQAFLNSLKLGNAYGTTGPMLEIRLGGKQMGEMFNGQRGDLELEIFAVDWISLDRVDIQINGETIDQHKLKTGQVKRLRLPLTFTKDSFVTVEVHGIADQRYSAIYPGIEPYAFSNPIYVDFDGDGVWTAPGL